MKKIIAGITLSIFVVALAGMVYADARTPADKLEAGRAYLKLLDKKIIRLRKAGKTALVNKMKADKKATIARMKEWKAEAEGEAAPAAPTPAAPTPPRAPIAAKPAALGAGLLGLGLNSGYTVGYLMGNSIIAARGDLILADALGIGPMLGLADDAVAWKIGMGAATGTDASDNSRTAIPLFVDGIIAVPADVLGGIESYIGGGLNYSIYGSGGMGSYGGQVYYGVQADVGLGGISYAELGYSIIRSGSMAFSMRGIGVNFGTQLLL